MYRFTHTFNQAYLKNLGRDPDEDDRAYISMICNTGTGHKKIDNKGRPSIYWTCNIREEPITIVGDYEKGLIVTAVRETHKKALSKLI